MDRTSINIRKATLAKLNQARRELSQLAEEDLTADQALWRLLQHWDATKPAKAPK